MYTLPAADETFTLAPNNIPTASITNQIFIAASLCVDRFRDDAIIDARCAQLVDRWRDLIHRHLEEVGNRRRGHGASLLSEHREDAINHREQGAAHSVYFYGSTF
jgi:hypothetical protein